MVRSTRVRRFSTALLATSLLLLSAFSAGCGSTAGRHAAAPAKKAASTAQTSAPGKAAAGPVKIGWLGGLTGFLAQDSASAKAGAAMAVAKVNAAGGVLGRHVLALYEDTGTNPQKARQAVQTLALKDHVAGIVGDYFSPNTIAIMPLIARYRVPTITYLSQADRITHEHNRYMFRTNVSSRASAVAIALYAMNTRHFRRFVMLGGTDSYSGANLRDFQASVKQHGGTIVGSERYNPTTKDFAPYLLKFEHARFDAFFLGGSPLPNALIVKQARAAGMDEPILGTTGLDRKITWQGAGQAVVGAELSLEVPGAAVNGQKDLNPNALAFEKAWLAAGHSRPSMLAAAHSYDATMLLLRAIQTAGTTRGPAVRQAILNIGKHYQGAAGNYSMQPDGGTRMPMFIARWGADGHLRIVAQVPSSEVYGH